MAGELAGARRRAKRALVHAPDDLLAVHALESLTDIAMFEGHLDESAGFGRRLYRTC